MAKKKDGGFTKTRELTDSNTATRSGERIPTIEELLGNKESPSIDSNQFMLKLKTAQRLDKILDELHLESSIIADDKVALVLGPFSKSQIQALSEARLLSRKDELLTPQSTWKSIHDVLPDIKNDKLLSDEVTSTASLTESVTETLTTPTKNISEEEAIQVLEQETVVRPPIEETVPPRSPLKQRPKNAHLEVQLPKTKTSQRPSLSSWSWLALLGVVIAVFAFWKFGNLKSPTKGTDTIIPQTDSNLLGQQDWPETLKIRDYEELIGARPPLVARLYPILEAYEKGAKAVSETDLRMLRVLAGPGSASLEARVIATNMLAAFALSRSQTEEANKLLSKLLEVVPTDSTTLVNQSLVHLVAREYKDAKDVASTALRLCKGQSCWVSRAILGLIASEESRWVEAEENFKGALSDSRGSLWVVGLWLRSLKLAPKDLSKTRSTSLLTESLVLDPDLMIDSPLHAPLATQILLTEVLRGFRSAMALVPDALTEGQRKYLEWTLSRYELNPLSTSAAEALAKLKSETQALSQLASSYLEKELGSLDKSSELISRTINRLSGTNIKSSWPWSFAGDVQRNRGLSDQAILFYEAALSRNPRDVNAVFGLALILRDKKDYKAAFQKVEEASSLDPNYIPAQLRRDRFEWEKYWFSK